MPHPPLHRSLSRVVAVTALLLLVPLVAMQLTREVSWGPGDFVAAAILLIGAGTVYTLGARVVRGARSRALLAAGVAAGLALVWAELAVGLLR